MWAASTQKFIAPGCAVSADYVDLTTGVVKRRGQLAEQVEQMRIEMAHLSGAMIAEIMVELIQRFRQVSFAAPVNDVEPLTGMGVIETEPIFARGRHGEFRRLCKRRPQPKHNQPQRAVTDR